MYYCDNLASYMGKLNNGQGMDLTLYKSVPKSLYIQVGRLPLGLPYESGSSFESDF